MLARMFISLKGGTSHPTEEQWEVIHQLFPETKESTSKYFFESEIVMDSEQLMIATEDKGFSIRIESVSPHSMLVKIKDKYDHSISSVENYQRGTIVQVHVPSMALLTYNEVHVLDDSCTDILQEYLNKGWRIIAVCPPNAQRRPDYILGRYNSDGKNN